MNTAEFTRTRLFTASSDGGETSIDALMEAFEANATATNTALERANTEIAGLRTRLDQQVRPAAARGNGPLASREPDDRVRSVAHRAALARFMSTGDEAALRVENTAAASMSVQDDPAGGYLVPTEISRTIINLQRDVSPMRRLAQVAAVSGAEYAQPINKHGTAGGWVTEKHARPRTDASDLSLLRVPSNELYAEPAVTQKLIDDATFDIAGWVTSEIALRFSELEGSSYITGSGVEQPLGLLSVPIVKIKDDARPFGSFEYKPTGAAGAFNASGPADALIDLIYGLKVGYRPNASWLMNSTTTAVVSKLKDGQGNYLWNQSRDKGQPSTLLGYPVENDEGMPDIGANSMSIAFGDFKRGYLIVDRFDIRILRDPYTAKPFVLFYATKRVGGAPLDTQAIKFMKFATT